MTKKVVVPTINGPQTIEGMTVGALRKAIYAQPDDQVVVFMFEVTPTVRKQITETELMIMPAWSVFGGTDIFVFVGPEIENAPFEQKAKWAQESGQTSEPPPVDRTQRTTTNGQPLDQRPETDSPDGQHSNYVVLTPEERSKGFVRPVYDCYKHLECGAWTTMSKSIAETYARDPGFYGATYCQKCKGHFPVGEEGEFVWIDSFGNERGKVGT